MRICNRCIMDDTANEITFDDDGVCNFCHQAQKSLKEIEAEKHKLPEFIKQIKKDGKGKKYDCLIGLSGGVDSSTVLHHAIKLGLRPLCYSVDNGYNDPKADENILRMVEKLKVPFYRYTIDIGKFKSLQWAFIEAGQKNIEIPTDHILMATTYEMASKYDIKWVLSGGNTATESIMPPSWGYNARDLRHIKDIYNKMSGKRLKGLPVCGLLKFNYYKWIKKIKMFYLLDFIDYHRDKSIRLLEKEYGYQPYGEKHCESNITKWFQEFYLLRKFGIDKRKPHYSSLINSGQISRGKAKKQVRKHLKHRKYPLFGFEDMVMQYPKRDYKEFKTDEKVWNFICHLIRVFRRR